MGKKLSPEDSELYKRLDEVLHYIWDPIGVAGAPGARDEYYDYLSELFDLTKAEASLETITDYLVEAETISMGLNENRSNARAAAKVCGHWRKWIEEYGF